MRPREFDRDVALDQAMQVFWAKGFAATSTDELLEAMGIGRQSLYNAFGDKRTLYLEVLKTYQQRTTSAHIARLNSASSPIAGIRALLLGLAPSDARLRKLGCMGVCSVGEFGTSDAEVAQLRNEAAPRLLKRVAERIEEGRASGEIEQSLEPNEAAGFVLMAMTGLQVAARAGAGPTELARLISFTVDRLRAS
jgi:AcrR family transcriptional regulator